MRISAALFISFLSVNTAFAAKHTCRDYHNDLEKLRAQEFSATTLPVQTRVMRGFLYGAFNATRAVNSDNLQDVEAQAFEETVIAECRKRPDEKTATVILDQIRKQSPRGATPPEPEWSPEKAALMVAYIDWGISNCGEFPNPILMAYVGSIRNGINPELLKKANSHILQSSKNAGLTKKQMCEEYAAKMNEKPF